MHGADKKYTYYLQFAEDMDVTLIPVRELSSVGTWARRSSHVYEGRSSHTLSELSDYLTGTCGIRKNRFTLIPAEEGIIIER